MAGGELSCAWCSGKNVFNEEMWLYSTSGPCGGITCRDEENDDQCLQKKRERTRRNIYQARLSSMHFFSVCVCLCVHLGCATMGKMRDTAGNYRADWKQLASLGLIQPLAHTRTHTPQLKAQTQHKFNPHKQTTAGCVLIWQCSEVDGRSTNQSHKAPLRIPLIAPNSVHFCPIFEPNHLKYHKIRVGIPLPGALIWEEPMTVQRKMESKRGVQEYKRDGDKKKKQSEEQNAMNYRKRQKRPGLAS